MLRFYTNENFPFPTVLALRNLGYDVQTSQDVGNAGLFIEDEEVLAYAIKNNRIVLTLNRRHFIQLHNTNPDHSGIIVCKFNPDFENLASIIHEKMITFENLNGKLIRINREKK